MQLDLVAITLWSKIGGVSHWVGRQFDEQKFWKYTYYCGVRRHGLQENFEFYQFQESILGYFMQSVIIDNIEQLLEV